MLIVQKYGGTSIGSLERIEIVVNRIIKLKQKEPNCKLVIVVSAMSGETNKLLEYSKYFSKNPNKRDVDMLLSSGERVTSALVSIALNNKNYKAISFSGQLAGIKTSDDYNDAKIENINPTLMLEKLNENYIVIVAGFQGINSHGFVTTLGRGGSDLSAVAIAGTLKADLCEIYTDVDGIYTTDPRIEPKAKKINHISYDEMLELSSLGAKVLQSRSVEMAKKFSINLCTRSSFNENEGTMITKENKDMENPIVSGIALDKSKARISMVGVEDKPGIISDLFTILGEGDINVDMIVQTVGHDGKTNIDFTVFCLELEKTKKALKKFDDEFDIIDYDEDIAIVSIVGVGMKSHTGVASKGFVALSNDNINVIMISTSEIKISIVIEEKYGELAVRALHSAYELDV